LQPNDDLSHAREVCRHWYSIGLDYSLHRKALKPIARNYQQISCETMGLIPKPKTITCMICLPGMKIACADTAGNIIIYDLRLQQPIQLLKHHHERINCLYLISPFYLASAGMDGDICIWDLTTFSCCKQLAVNNEIFLLITKLKDGYLAAITSDNRLYWWPIQLMMANKPTNLTDAALIDANFVISDIASGKMPLAMFELANQRLLIANKATIIDWDMNTNIVAEAFWDLAAWPNCHMLTKEHMLCYAMLGPILFAGSSAGKLYMAETNDFKHTQLMSSVKISEQPLHQLLVLANAQLLLRADDICYVFDSKRMQIINSFEFNGIYHMAATKSGNIILLTESGIKFIHFPQIEQELTSDSAKCSKPSCALY
jgi:WD40 repeat protein